MGRRLHLSVRMVLLITSPIAMYEEALASRFSTSASSLNQIRVYRSHTVKWETLTETLHTSEFIGMSQPVSDTYYKEYNCQFGLLKINSIDHGCILSLVINLSLAV